MAIARLITIFFVARLFTNIEQWFYYIFGSVLAIQVFFDSCYQSKVWGYDTPAFTKEASAYDINSYLISSPEEIETDFEKLWENPFKPFLLEVSIDVHTNVFPKIMYGSPITKMEPGLSLPERRVLV